MDERSLTRPPIMTSLLWKDGRSVQSLVAAIWIGILGINLMCYLLTMVSNFYGEELNLYVCAWLLLPNLVALGAPAMLVGNEEETGTLDWLRTLPVTAKRIVDSKFIVGLAAVVVTWVIASIVMFLVASGWTTLPAFAADLLQPLGVAKAFLVSCALLLLGFVTAYLIRSPIGAILTLVPLVIAVTQCFFVGADLIVERFFESVNIADISIGQQALLAVYSIGFLFALWLLQRIAGVRRMTAARRSRPMIAHDPSIAAYRPPQATGLDRPGAVTALLWQQARQVALPISVLTGLSLLSLLAVYSFEPSWNHNAVSNLVGAVALPLILLSASWMGSMVFFGDSYRRRCGFFADRGISVTRIWWTRLLLPGACCWLLAMIASGLSDGSNAGPPAKLLWAMIIVAFAFGQLTSQWVTRAVLAFFAAPAYMLVGSVLLINVYEYYPNYEWTYVLMAPVLLFATWRLCSRWLEGRIDNGFHWRMVGYTALSVLVPLLAIAGERIATTPPLDANWRATAMTASNQLIKDPANINSTVDHTRISPDAHWPFMSPQTEPNYFLGEVDQRELLDAFQNEIMSDKIGEFVSAVDLMKVVQHDFSRGDLSRKELTEMRRNAIVIALKWARIIRERVVDGTLAIYMLERIAEPAERFAVQQLLNHETDYGRPDDIRLLVAAVPDERLRLDSRRRALLRAWRRYQFESIQRAEGNDTSRRFSLYQLSHPDIPKLWFEDRRMDRYVDEATRLTWQQLEQGLPAAGSEGARQRRALWNEVFHPSVRNWYAGDTYSLVGTYWISDHEDAVRQLRARYPSGRSED